MDVKTGKSLWSANTHDILTSLDALPGASTSLIIAAENRHVSAWDPRSASRGGCIMRDMPNASSSMYSIAASPDGHTIAVGGQDKTVYVYDTRTWKLCHR